MVQLGSIRGQSDMYIIMAVRREKIFQLQFSVLHEKYVSMKLILKTIRGARCGWSPRYSFDTARVSRSHNL